jgi:hypothetical protein
MEPVIHSASCITAAEYADVLVEPEVSSVNGEGGVAFTLPFTVHSVGNQFAQGVELHVSLPASSAASVESASSSQGSCSVTGLTATCVLGDLDVNASAQVSVVARGSSAGSFTAQAGVTADNDRLTSNNNRQVAVTLRSGIDGRVAIGASAAEYLMGSPVEVSVDVSSQRAMPVRNATLSLNLNQPVASATLDGASCALNASSVTCSIAEIPSGATRRLTVAATARNAGPLFASAGVSVPGDGDLSNNTANTTAWVQGERDVELTTTASSVDLAVNASYEVAYLLRSRGTAPTGDVSLQFSLPAGLIVDPIDSGGAPCLQSAARTWRCEFGVLPAGVTWPVRVRVHAAEPVAGEISAAALTSDDSYLGNNYAYVPVRIDHLVDLGITLASGGAGIEDTRFEGQVALRSNGRQPASQATLDIQLHADGVLRSARIQQGDDCALLTDTLARCSLPTLARNASLYVDYTAEFAEPGTYDVTFTASAAGDTAPGNDSLNRAVLVRPFQDAGVSGSLAMDGLFGGQRRERTFTLTTDRRALPTARFLAAHAWPGLRVDAITADAGECRVDADLGGICDFTDLPAHSRIGVSVSYLAAEPALVSPVVSVSTPGDVVGNNNVLGGQVEVMGGTDVELRVGGSLTGARASTLSFPVIELFNGSHKAITPRLEVSLPPQVRVVDVSALDAVCSGTTTLRCDFPTLEAFASASVNLSIMASADGSFIGRVSVSTANDLNTANDSREVALEISGGNVAASSAPGGTGGGGRFEWIALLWLALAVVGRVRRAALRPRA